MQGDNLKLRAGWDLTRRGKEKKKITGSQKKDLPGEVFEKSGYAASFSFLRFIWVTSESRA
jgi:hypothetical protein